MSENNIRNIIMGIIIFIIHYPEIRQVVIDIHQQSVKNEILEIREEITEIKNKYNIK